MLQGGSELPAPVEALSEYFSKTFVIALAGADKEDLHNAKWVQIPRQDFVEASRFCTAHSLAYDGCVTNEERAKQLFDQGESWTQVLEVLMPA